MQCGSSHQAEEDVEADERDQGLEPEHKIKRDPLDPDLSAKVGVDGFLRTVSATVVATAGAFIYANKNHEPELGGVVHNAPAIRKIHL